MKYGRHEVHALASTSGLPPYYVTVTPHFWRNKPTFLPVLECSGGGCMRLQ